MKMVASLIFIGEARRKGMIAMEYQMLSLFDLTPDLVCIAGRNGYFKKVNPAVLLHLGYPEEELFSRPIDSFIHPLDLEETRLARRRLLEGHALFNYQNRYITKKGEVIWLQWTSILLPGKDAVLAIAKDITSNKLREQQTEERYQAFRDLATHFKTRAEQDKYLLARELHEELAQVAAAQKMNILWLKKKLADAAAPLLEKLEESLQMSDMLIRDIRRMSVSTSPTLMDDLGMQAAFEWKCTEFSRNSGIPCTYLHRCPEEVLSRELKIDFFRVCEEALDNIRDHAQAAAAWVSIEDRGTEAAIVVTDNGIGFDTGRETGTVRGLQNIRQLALSVNGRLELESIPGEGTKVSFVAPKSAVPHPPGSEMRDHS